MLDKTIPYFNIIMKRKAGQSIPSFELPEGYSFVPYTDGAEKDWAEIEASVGEFDSAAEALEYFSTGYLSYPNEVKRRTIFIQNSALKKVGTATGWWNYTGERRDPSLEWVAVLPEYQGLGLGKAVVFECVNRMLTMEGDRDIYLHTQTWSCKAIEIYLQAGFEFMKSGTFSEYDNDYDRAMPLLVEKLRCYSHK